MFDLLSLPLLPLTHPPSWSTPNIRESPFTLSLACCLIPKDSPTTCLVRGTRDRLPPTASPLPPGNSGHLVPAATVWHWASCWTLSAPLWPLASGFIRQSVTVQSAASHHLHPRGPGVPVVTVIPPKVPTLVATSRLASDRLGALLLLRICTSGVAIIPRATRILPFQFSSSAAPPTSSSLRAAASQTSSLLFQTST